MRRSAVSELELPVGSSGSRSRAGVSAVALSKSAARRIWLRAQRLGEIAPFGAGPEATRAAIEHLGYVQIDTINVIERCHHHILFTRIPDYRRVHLTQAQSIDKSIFEYWTHALSYVPTRDLRFYRRAMRREWQQRTRWYAEVSEAELRRVLRRVKESGALTIRDIDDDVLIEKEHLWQSRKPSKRVLQVAFYRGQLVISQRTGMLKTYELAGRHFGWDKPPAPASEKEVLGHLLERALRAQGIVSLDSICHLNAHRKSAIRQLIEARLRRRELVTVEVEGAGRQEHWARPDALDQMREPAGDLVHILSPFDPLVIQRKRLKLFFDYDHVFEAYVPQEKRVYGYFALPVLIGDEIVAAIDLKADREQEKLLIQRWTWIAAGARKENKRRVENALHRFEHFQLAR